MNTTTKNVQSGWLPVPRWSVLLLALLAGLATAQDLVHEELRDTRCWECHQADPNTPTPLRQFWQGVPEEVTVTGPTSVGLNVQNTWYQDITRLTTVLDLSEAPSLAFVDERAPLNRTVTGSAHRVAPSVTPAPPPQIVPVVDTPPAYGNLTIHVPEGATSLVLSLMDVEPNAGPYIEWQVHTLAPDPLEVVSQSVDSQIHMSHPTQFLQHGYGEWRIEARIPNTDPSGFPNIYGERVALRAHLEVAFDPTARVAVLSSDSLLEPGQTERFTWTLQQRATPGPDEHVQWHINGTVHHEHLVTSNAIDEAHVTTRIRLPVQADGGARIQSDVVLVEVPQTGGSLLVPIAEILGYVAGASILLSLLTGGLFGRTSRRWLNTLFGSARQRVAFHNVLSYGILLFSTVHLVMFLWHAFDGGPYHWTLGLLWGGLGMIGLFGLGLTGAMQVPMLRRWNYATWRWTHFGLAMLALVASTVHLLLDGAHFGAVQEAVGWHDPLDPR